MKTHRIILTTLLLAPALLRAQGNLTPPAGPPVASMKTLDQVEARTPLIAGAAGVTVSAAGSITISQPGSYYLTKNLTIDLNVDGLIINADATVDLNGFGIIGTAAAITTADAVTITTTANVTLRNGFIKGGTTIAANGTYTGSGFDTGVAADAPPTGVRSTVNISDLQVTGVRGRGIFLRRCSRVERCTVQVVGGNGIDVSHWIRPDTATTEPRFQSYVCDSHASDCGGQYGIGATRVSSSFGHATQNASSDYQSAVCGILALQVESSTGWATGTDIQQNNGLFGIHGYIVSYSSGKAVSKAINAQSTAVACRSEGGTITSPQKHLGTP